MKQRVLIAMSGGVDSSVTAFLLKSAGYDCAGATMRLTCSRAFDDAGPDSCCSLKDLEDAEAVCTRLGIPWQALDYRDVFEREVVQKFVTTYEAGRTPNPCIDCNRHLKFGALLDYARDQGFDYIATGHYAQVRPLSQALDVAVGNPTGSREGDMACGTLGRLGEICDERATPSLSLAIDPGKDQSYVLYALNQERLAHTLLPLGGLIKERDVRRIAREQGFSNAQKSDSQGICFVPDNDFATFIERRRGRALPEGDIVDTSGRVLGRHRGAIRYTVGQRKGLGVACAHPVYVSRIDAVTNTVVLGEKADLDASGLVAHDWIWSAPQTAMEQLLDGTGEDGVPVGAKIRYRHPIRAARLRRAGDGAFRVDFDEPERGIAPGQAVVIYAGGVVLGGGTVREALR